jgi:hypothetical protein
VLGCDDETTRVWDVGTMMREAGLLEMFDAASPTLPLDRRQRRQALESLPDEELQKRVEGLLELRWGRANLDAELTEARKDGDGWLKKRTP